MKNDGNYLLDADNLRDYEKTRFVALTCNRLGRLFYNAGTFNLSVRKYEKAIHYVEMINDTVFMSNLLKEMGNSYHFLGDADSALYCYNKSIETSTSLKNKLDVDKSISMILFEKGCRDTAYNIIKNNINIIQDKNLLCSYYNILGRFFYMDKAYDSAMNYLNQSFMSNNHVIKMASANLLMSICDSVGDTLNGYIYSQMVSDYVVGKINKSVDVLKIQELYDGYHKANIKEKNDNAKRKYISIIVVVMSAISLFVIIIATIHIKRKNELQKIIVEKERLISDAQYKLLKTEMRLHNSDRRLKSKTDELNRN